MSGPSQFQLREERDDVKAEIQQAKQELRDAQAAGDEKAVAFWRKQLELLGEKELILLRAQTTGEHAVSCTDEFALQSKGLPHQLTCFASHLG